MSKKLHWFPFYYLDWLSDSEVVMMTYSEKGLFIDMLSRCFNEGGLPADEKKLVRLFRCDAEDLKECVKMFYEKDEKLFNKKLDSIQKDQKVISKVKSKAGKASAEARKAKRLMKGTGVEHVLKCVATEAQHNSTSTVQNNTVQQSNKTKAKITDYPFELFWEMYDKKTGKPKCESKYQKLSEEIRKTIFEHVLKYKESQPDKQFRKNPDTYLNQQSWNDEIVSNAPQKPQQREIGDFL